MKDLIKQLASEQPELKKARKTGTLDKDYTWWNYKQWPEHVKVARQAANKVTSNKAKITAALNIMHEMKGSDYRHGHAKYEYYDMYYRELKESMQANR